MREALRREIESRVDTEGSRNILTDYDLDAIIAVIRDALLSDEAMLSARDSGLIFDTDRGKRYVSSPEHIVTAALNATFGEENGHE